MTRKCEDAFFHRDTAIPDAVARSAKYEAAADKAVNRAHSPQIATLPDADVLRVGGYLVRSRAESGGCRVFKNRKFGQENVKPLFRGFERYLVVCYTGTRVPGPVYSSIKKTAITFHTGTIQWRNRRNADVTDPATGLKSTLERGGAICGNPQASMQAC